MSRRLNEAKPEKKKNKTKQNKIRELPLANIGTLETRGSKVNVHGYMLTLYTVILTWYSSSVPSPEISSTGRPSLVRQETRGAEGVVRVVFPPSTRTKGHSETSITSVEL